MSVRSVFLRGGVQLFAGYSGQQALVFLRNILIARLIGPDDFGTAVTFMIIISALEVMSDLGVEHYIVRAEDGEDPAVMRTLHAILLGRGLLIGAVVFLCADTVATLFEVPEAAWVYQVLAVVPVIKGFVHLDMRRQQREFIYRPNLMAMISGTLAGLGIAVALGYAWRSYEAMLWAFIGEALIMVAVSHIVATRPYGMAIDKSRIRALVKYGWPLMLNGLIIFLMGQGDRLIVGSQMGVRELANYAVASILATGPSLLAMKVTGALYLPLLRNQDVSPETYVRRYELCGALTALAVFAVVLLLVFYGVPITVLLYGSEYDVPAFVMAWLAIAAGARIMRSWPMAVALASGQTKEVLFPNLLRLTGFAAAVFSVMAGYGAEGVALSVGCGELIAVMFAVVRSDGNAGLRTSCGRKLVLLFVVISGISLAVLHYVDVSWHSVLLHVGFLGMLALALVGLIVLVPSFKLWMWNAVSKTGRGRTQ